MPPFPAETPPEGQNVTITLTSGAIVTGYWDGAQWWCGIPDEPNDLPLDNSHVAAWAL